MDEKLEKTSISKPKMSVLKSVLDRTKNVLKQVTVEPFMLFLMFGFQVKMVTFQSLLIDRACRLQLNYPDEICDHLDLHVKEQQQSVVLGNNMNVGCMMAATLPSVIVSIFIGPWSDRYGRRYPMILATAGVLIDAILTAILSSSAHASPYLYIFSGLIAGFSGGLVVSLSTSYSYVSDITDERSRPTRFAILEFFFIIATPLGTLIGGKVFEVGSYVGPIALGACGFACSLVWVVFMVRNLHPVLESTTKKQIILDLFSLDNVKNSFKTCLAPRAGNLRLQLWLLIFVSCITKIINIGSFSIAFSYTKTVLKWGVTRYSDANTLFYIVSAMATVISVPILNKKLLLHEAAVGLVGTFSLMSKMVILSVSTKEGLVYYAFFCGMLNALCSIAVRSRISKLVSKQELGRVFSLLATCEALTPVAGASLMSQIFNATVETYPGLTFAVSAVILVPVAIIFGWMTKLPTMSFAEYQEHEHYRQMKEMEDVSDFDAGIAK